MVRGRPGFGPSKAIACNEARKMDRLLPGCLRGDPGSPRSGLKLADWMVSHAVVAGRTFAVILSMTAPSPTPTA